MMDIGLLYDPATRTIDIAVEGRDLLLDRTPATTMLLALGCDRRARPDDALPAAPAPAGFGDRRGWCGDAMDGQGRRLGSRLWLLARAKQSELTRLRAIQYAEEALAGLAERGFEVTVDAAWRARGVLGLTARADGAEVVVNLQATS